MRASSEAEIVFAQNLLGRWNEGNGDSKSQLEIEVWQDATSHGRRFDRFVRTHLGVNTSRPSKQTDRIVQLERQVRNLGGLPIGANIQPWERQLRHARESCLAALRAWNDPTARFRTGAFSLLVVTGWNGLATAVLQKSGGEWRKTDVATGQPMIHSGAEVSLDIRDLIQSAFAGDQPDVVGLRENVRFWVDLRNCVAVISKRVPNRGARSSALPLAAL